MPIVSPSILSANMANFEGAIEMLNRSEAEMIHLDVMDGVFVPNITFGFQTIKALRKLTDKTLDAHLMIVDPGRYVNQMRDSGATIMNVHYEACTHLDRVIQQIHQAGMQAGVTINPATPVCMLEDIIAEVELVLIMSVNPGFAAQKFIPQAIEKVRKTKELIQRTGSKALIEVDGGINAETGKLVKDAGADILVAGNFVFSAPDPLEAIKQLKNL